MEYVGDRAIDGQAGRSPGRSVRLFLADGSPQGLIVAEIPNWSGKVLAAPRAWLGDLLKRGEASRTGIYVLTGPDPENAHGQLAYIGEADDVAARIRIHMRSADKDFFDRVAIITSSDDNVTKSHARFLESLLIARVRRACRLDGHDEPPGRPRGGGATRTRGPLRLDDGDGEGRLDQPPRRVEPARRRPA